MTTTTLNKTVGTTAVAAAALATATVAYSAAIDVSTKLGIVFFPRIGRTSATALAAEVLMAVEASAQASGNDSWFQVFPFTSGTCKTAANSTTVAAGLPVTAGDSTINLTSVTGIGAGDVLYLAEATKANSEFVRVKSVAALVATLYEPCTRSHAAGVVVTDFGEIIPPIYADTSAYSRMRFLFDAAATPTTTSVDVSCTYSTLDSANTV